MTEAEIKRSIAEYLESLGDRVLFTVNSAGRKGYQSKFLRKGWPDISGMVSVTRGTWAQPFFIEVKKPGGTLSLEQHKILERAKSMGAITCVATCVEDVRNAVR